MTTFRRKPTNAPGLMDATIHVYTFKEGLLSKLAHDLKLSLTRFEIRARGTTVEGRFEPASLRVLGVVREGVLDERTLSAGDREKIQENMAREVLHVREHPEVRFDGRVTTPSAPYVVEGTLALAGRTAPLSITLALRNGRLRGDVELAPSNWSIKPYRALGGALKVQDRVRVSVDASAAWFESGAALNPSVELVWRPV